MQFLSVQWRKTDPLDGSTPTYYIQNVAVGAEDHERLVDDDWRSAFRSGMYDEDPNVDISPDLSTQNFGYYPTTTRDPALHVISADWLKDWIMAEDKKMNFRSSNLETPGVTVEGWVCSAIRS